MAWQYPISATSSGATVDLSSTDSVFVAEYVTVTANGTANTAILGNGSDHHAIIEGTVAGHYGVFLGDHATDDSGQSVVVRSTGSVYSGSAYAVSVYGASSRIDNAGTIEGGFCGVYVSANSVGGFSSIVNVGTIKGDTSAIQADGGQAIRLINKGHIESEAYAFFGGTENDRVVNAGTMVGDIVLGGGVNFYDGRKGRIDGSVVGGDFTNKFLGGIYKDNFAAGNSTDTLSGGGGGDLLAGGADANDFIYAAVTDSGIKAKARDTIADFSQIDGDLIDLARIDANSVRNGSQAFKFIGDEAFHGVAGELRYQSTATDTMVYADINGDSKADFAIKLTGVIALTGGDFLL